MSWGYKDSIISYDSLTDFAKVKSFGVNQRYISIYLSFKILNVYELQ